MGCALLNGQVDRRSLFLILINVIITLFYSDFVLAQNIITTSAASMMRAEAIHGWYSGADSLFYNPALLSKQKQQIRPLSIDFEANENGGGWISQQNESSGGQAKTNTTLASLFDKIDSNKPMTAEVRGRAVDLAFPNFAITSYSSKKLVYHQSGVGSAMSLSLAQRLGVAGGFAFSVGKLSIGVSRYFLVETSFASQPTKENVDQVKTDLNNGNLATALGQLSDKSQMTFGTTQGTNLGVKARFWDNNPSGIGIGILNYDGSRFSQTDTYGSEEVKHILSKVSAEATAAGLTLASPAPLKQQVNIGLVLAKGTDKDTFHALIEADYLDAENKKSISPITYSAMLGFRLPNKVALETAWYPKIDDDNQGMVHLGLLSMNLIGGFRPGEYYTNGIDLGWHLGYFRTVSLMEIHTKIYKIVYDNQNSSGVAADERIYGTQGTIDFVLMF